LAELSGEYYFGVQKVLPSGESKEIVVSSCFVRHVAVYRS